MARSLPWASHKRGAHKEGPSNSVCSRIKLHEQNRKKQKSARCIELWVGLNETRIEQFTWHLGCGQNLVSLGDHGTGFYKFRYWDLETGTEAKVNYLLSVLFECLQDLGNRGQDTENEDLSLKIMTSRLTTTSCTRVSHLPLWSKWKLNIFQVPKCLWSPQPIFVSFPNGKCMPFHQGKEVPSGLIWGTCGSPIEKYAATFCSQGQQSEESPACELC